LRLQYGFEIEFVDLLSYKFQQCQGIEFQRIFTVLAKEIPIPLMFVGRQHDYPPAITRGVRSDELDDISKIKASFTAIGPAAIS
jgi:hypothetical protein